MKHQDILDRALRIVRPTARERKILEATAEKALQIVSELASGLPGIVDVSLEGSAAKDTWIRERMEADVFIHFDPSVPREAMEREVVRIGMEAIRRMGGEPMLMYAEHPYVEGTINNVTIDIVACYRVKPPNWISATDRTPYHTRYVRERMTRELRDQVRLLKKFLLSCEAYGAEIKVRGFSGYLSELLILAHGGFYETVMSASKWRPPIVIDLEVHYGSRDEVVEAFQGQSLIVVDPVDRRRNVAAAVSDTRLAEFILASKLFAQKPSLKFFRAREPRTSLGTLRRLIRKRNILFIEFRVGGRIPPDVLWGELRRTEKGVRKALERLGFQVYRSDSWTNLRDCVISLELDSSTLPSYELRRGPPAYMDNSLDFVLKWVRKGVSGPWLDGFRLYVLSERRETRAEKLLRSEIRMGRVSLAKDLHDKVKKARITTSLNNLPRKLLRDPDFQKHLHRFLQHRPNYL